MLCKLLQSIGHLPYLALVMLTMKVFKCFKPVDDICAANAHIVARVDSGNTFHQGSRNAITLKAHVRVPCFLKDTYLEKFKLKKLLPQKVFFRVVALFLV